MIVSIHDVAQKLLAMTTSITASTPNYGTVTVEAGRVGEGGEIRTETFAEISDAPWRFEGIAAGVGASLGTGQFGIVVYHRYAKDPEREKERLHYLVEALFDAIRQNPTLDDLVDDARVIEIDSGFDPTRGYWMMVVLVEVLVNV